MRTEGEVRWIVWELDVNGERTFGEKCPYANDAEAFAATLTGPFEIEMVVLFKIGRAA